MAPGPVITHYALSLCPWSNNYLRAHGPHLPGNHNPAPHHTLSFHPIQSRWYYYTSTKRIRQHEPCSYLPRQLPTRSGGRLQLLHSSLPGAVSARLLSPAILCRMPSITACLRVSKKLSCRTTRSSCGKWHARTTSHVAPSTCQNSRRLLDAARRRRALFLTLPRKLLVVSPLPRQQSEEPEPDPEAVGERLKLGVLLHLQRLRS